MIQQSQASLRALAKRYRIDQKIVAKRRTSVADQPTGPKEARSTVLSLEQEAIIIAFRKHTLLPLDDCLYALQPTLPHLTRSSLHRCLQRHGISQLPPIEGEVSVKQNLETYPIGFFHIDIAEIRTGLGSSTCWLRSIASPNSLLSRSARTNTWRMAKRSLSGHE